MTGEDEGAGVFSRAPVSREGYTGAARVSESPAWGTLRSCVASLDRHRFFPTNCKGVDASHQLPFFLLPFSLL